MSLNTTPKAQEHPSFEYIGPVYMMYCSQIGTSTWYQRKHFIPKEKDTGIEDTYMKQKVLTKGGKIDK